MRVNGAAIKNPENLIWIADLPAHWAARDAAKTAMVFEDRTVTYADFDRGASRLCALWQSAGYKPGDIIGYFGRNSELFYYVLFACARGGFILASYNWRYAAPELAFVLDDSKPRLLIHDPDFGPLIEKAMASLGAKPRLMPTEGSGADTLRAQISGPVLSPKARTYRFNDPFLQLYTSGTTGHPKGALLSHGFLSLFRNAYFDTPQWENWSRDDIILSAMPNFHIAGIGFCMIGMGVGATIIHTADPSPSNLIRLSNAHTVNRIYMVPTIIRMVLEELDATGGQAPKYDGIYYGAAPIGVLLDKAMATFRCRFTQFYGMTEASTTHVLGPADHDATRPQLMNSVGRPLAGVAMEIRRADRTPCDVGEHGEIWIHSEMMMLGYANRPEATAEAIVDGWYRTGDGGYTDKDGYLYLTDRLKEMIISGGENVYPIEVENALRLHQAVRDVAVVGMPDPKWGETVTAIIELKSETSPTFDELRTFTKERLAGYKCPKAIYVADALPRTASGKVQRGVAKSMLERFRRLDS